MSGGTEFRSERAMKVVIRVINNLGDLERIRRELQQIVALDGKKVTITVVQRGFATGSMLPKFPSLEDARRLISVHHREVGVPFAVTRQEAVQQFRFAVFSDRLRTSRSLRQKLDVASNRSL